MENYDELQEYVRQLWIQAGRPSSRRLAHRTFLSHTTVNDGINGRRELSHQSMRALIAALRGDVSMVERLIGTGTRVVRRGPGTVAVYELLQQLAVDQEQMRSDITKIRQHLEAQ